MTRRWPTNCRRWLASWFPFSPPISRAGGGWSPIARRRSRWPWTAATSHATTRDGPRSLPLLEVELELKQGPPDALFSLARQLGHHAHLRPVAASKSERGYVLFQGRRAKAVKAEAVTLPPSEHPVDAFRRVALACLSQLQANEAGVLHSDDIEYLHQARVALRRLRAALRVFAPALPRKFVARWGAAWKALALSLGNARDHDVFRTSLLPGLIPLLGPRDATRLQTWARVQGDVARDAARHSLASRDTSEHLLAFTRALLRLKVDDGAAPAASLEPWARKRLRQRHQSLMRRIRSADLFDAVERHQVRIEAKKLRYALDFLASLWPPERLNGLTEALVQAQDLLGQMNDRVSAQRLLATAPKAGADRLQMVLGAQLVESAAHLPLVLKALTQAPVPWK
jgi:triphosphatase